MLESEDYALMLGMGASELEYINAANTGDYDSPTAVYAIRLNHEKWEKKLIDSLSPEQKEHWNRLPDWMRQQLMWITLRERWINMRTSWEHIL